MIWLWLSSSRRKKRIAKGAKPSNVCETTKLLSKRLQRKHANALPTAEHHVLENRPR